MKATIREISPFSLLWLVPAASFFIWIGAPCVGLKEGLGGIVLAGGTGGSLPVIGAGGDTLVWKQCFGDTGMGGGISWTMPFTSPSMAW